MSDDRTKPYTDYLDDLMVGFARDFDACLCRHPDGRRVTDLALLEADDGSFTGSYINRKLTQKIRLT